MIHGQRAGRAHKPNHQGRTVKQCFYVNHNQLKAHSTHFLKGYNFARDSRPSKTRALYFLCKLWTQILDEFTLDPIHQMPGLTSNPRDMIVAVQAPLTEQGEGAPSARLLSRLGIPPSLFWGFVGLLLFMIGDGVESGYLSPYLGDCGLSSAAVASIFTVYGVGAAIAGWLSGALSDVWGPRRVITLGLVVWLVFQVAFLTIGLGHAQYLPVLLTYGLRGLGYPLFAFGFLV